MSYDDRRGDGARQSWELPLALVAAALVVGLAAATVQLLDERHRLAELRDVQTPQVQQSGKLRDQLQSLGAETARLADGGNAAAKQVVDIMRQQGVTLKVGDK
jgi:TolA-binding protein